MSPVEGNAATARIFLDCSDTSFLCRILGFHPRVLDA
jgi:hypothetical protein